MGEIPHENTGAQSEQAALFEQLDLETVNLAAIRRLTAYVSNKDVGENDIPAALLFWECVLSSHAANAGRSMQAPEYTEVVEYFQASPFTSRLPQLIKQEFHTFVGNIVQLGKTYEEAKKAYEAQQEGEHTTVELIPPPPSEVVVVQPAPRPPTKATRPRLPDPRPAPPRQPAHAKKRDKVETPEQKPPRPTTPMIRIEVPQREPLRPFKPELLKGVELKGDLSRLNRYLRLDDTLLNAFALHIGLAELPDTELPYSKSLLRLVRAKAIGPAEYVYKYRVTHHQDTVLNSTDMGLVKRMIPENPDVIVAESFRDIHALVCHGMLKGELAVQAPDLLYVVRAIFETKIPNLLEELRFK